MCIIIDTNSFCHVFEPNSQRHPDFKPVLDWIKRGEGKIVYGGSKYKEELRRARKYLGIFRELKMLGKLIVENDDKVDAICKDIINRIPSQRFNDHHLMAIVVATQCKLLCSCDKESFQFLKDSASYRKWNVSTPRIYSQPQNAHLLNNHNIASCCKKKRVSKPE